MRRERAFRTAMRARAVLCDAADNRTGGIEQLVLNWGNEEACRLNRVVWAQWQAYSKAWEKAYSLALHRDHIHEAGRFLWCGHCRELKAETVS